ncbi:hypothetical protein DOTSEDRAFT_77571 [Dothistroma septosporum NZE10]|uniref:nitric-oxide synthase (NADPH) n=1 Tax=Dothistroma septosporum (strain NZE10 / CBS 128990) TaxID=675120 RepID=N1PXR8_DOTSN|nr:hypothetical protein DOTSEDRAFT_77571 [Dothistroma septosporum NZE10]
MTLWEHDNSKEAIGFLEWSMSGHSSSTGSDRASSIPCRSLDSSLGETNHIHGPHETDQSSIDSDVFDALSTSPRRRSPRPKVSSSTVRETHHASTRPTHAASAEAEFSCIRNSYPLLQGTGCTPQFCQAGRMIKTNEPRVGRDQPVTAVLEQATDFLRQLRNDGIIDSDETLRHRTSQVLNEILENSSDRTEVDGSDLSSANVQARMGGQWDPTLAELEHGVRLAWKHSQRCIMRSEYKTLQVCDLRHVQESKQMGSSLVEHLGRAFGGGNITPTVFVFPARKRGERGPLVWNSQILSFAGYQNNDGSILGDPANAELTAEVIALGWTPPRLRTRWDLLPIVTMAERDDPVITEIPEGLFPLVLITHPRYRLQFERLGLRWVPAPALSQLGFEIGGVQYTAAPFVGWFMDAEIGVRDLADHSRYNVLPQVITSLGWSNSEQDLERAPEHERLALLSTAQAELNYAVFHSFTAAGVKMSDTLSASSMYSTFDDEHFRDKGFRLPANPYWLAPPQGSIIPIWHRGGSPNYQPMPLICRNRQDPVKAWKRELTKTQVDEAHCIQRIAVQLTAPHPKDALADSRDDEATFAIHILYCTAASTSRKLAQELQRRLSEAVSAGARNTSSVKLTQSLNDFAPHKAGANDVVLIVASTAGHGNVPPNGNKFEHNLKATVKKMPFRYLIFGNGNSSYHATYNACAKAVEQNLLDFGAQPLSDGLFNGDTERENPPWNQFDTWVRSILSDLSLVANESDVELADPVSYKQRDSVREFRRVKLLSGGLHRPNAIRHVVLDVGAMKCEALSHVALVPINDPKSVKKALRYLGLKGSETIDSEGGITARQFLEDFIDFDQPFRNLSRASTTRLSAAKWSTLTKLPLRDALPLLTRSWNREQLPDDVFNAMPLIAPRMFSVASCPRPAEDSGANSLELLMQSRSGGRMNNFFKGASPGDVLRIKYIETDMEEFLQDASTPTICFATGSGLAPIRSLLQHRQMQQKSNSSDPAQVIAPVTLIIGFRPQDSSVIANAIEEPLAAGIVDILLLTPSNPDKIRAQNRIFEHAVRDRIEAKLKIEQASVFVCAGAAAAEGFAASLSALVGCDIQAALGSRYVQEVYKPAC